MPKLADLRDELPNIGRDDFESYSPLLADGLSKGKIDAGRPSTGTGLPDLAFRLLVKEPLAVVLLATTVSPRSKAISRGI